MQNQTRNLLKLAPAVLLLLSCSLPFAIASRNGAPPTPVVNGNPIDTATVMPAAPSSPTATPGANPAVVLTVTSGSLNVRRGPSIYYDSLDFIKSGESATAKARNSQGDWLLIPLPGDPSSYGWVSTLTEFSNVQGDVNSLPVNNPDPAQPAYIRNCTFHPMLIQPGNILLAPQVNTPQNKHQFAPGNYSAYDQNQQGKPKVKLILLKEGDSIDITKDGLGNTYYCP